MRSTGDRAENYRDSASSRPYFTIPTSCDPRRGLSYRLFRTCEGRKESHTKTQRGRPESASSRRDRAKRLFKAACGNKPRPNERAPSFCLCVSRSEERSVGKECVL